MRLILEKIGRFIQPLEAVSMSNPISSHRLPKITSPSRQRLIDSFWAFSLQTHERSEPVRLQQIKVGVSAELAVATRATFNLEDDHVALIFNASLATLKRRQHQQKPMDSIASERIDRIASISQQALGAFESRKAVVRWMSAPNAAFGNYSPVLLCVTEIGARQVRRVLHALEWGGAA